MQYKDQLYWRMIIVVMEWANDANNGIPKIQLLSLVVVIKIIRFIVRIISTGI